METERQAKIKEDFSNFNGALYEGDIVTVHSYDEDTKHYRVSDSMNRIYYIEEKFLLFLN